MPATAEKQFAPMRAMEDHRHQLYAELAPLIRRLVRRYGEDPEMRLDLEGELYCRFDSLLDAFDPERGVPLKPYLVRQLAAAAYTYARGSWRRSRREAPLEAAASAGSDPTPEWDEALAAGLLRQSLPGALAALPPRQRQVVVWRYFDEKPFEEIAAALAIQPATARSLLRHALATLRKRIAI